MNNKDLFGDEIYCYTRAQAIDDGVLVDVSEIAKEAGFKISVVVTQAVWEKYVAWTGEDTDKQTYQDESGRLWDVIWMLSLASNRSRGKSDVMYELYAVPRDGRSRRPAKIQLKAVIHGGDHGEPAITVMLPTED
jgi:hypothetical protein